MVRARPPATFAIQGKASARDALSTQYMCSRCAIRYEVTEGEKAHCPLCEAEKRLVEAYLLAEQLRDENTNLRKKLDSLTTWVDHVHAIRDAMDLVGPEDMVFLKQVMYLYRDDRSYQLTALAKVTTDKNGRITKRQPMRNELMLTKPGQRQGERHQFTSIGGVAVVGYFDEMTRQMGEKQAMVYLLRAVSLYLTKAE